eukprot:TRINITY_DN773991_c0_g1_i1.p1 TRINITY_DN773991_c0_g1~~TRINITY_DN773991_c0_g1_i1.p1  ORF type:complete len:623 (-),score=181.78 TRINITY_DN773991_c0_g1_i1:300-2168(-)
MEITIIGDEKVGKSSLITSYLSKSFDENLAISSLGRMSTRNSELEIFLFDAPSREEDRDAIFDAVAESNVAILVYDLDREETFERIQSYWLEELSCRELNTPVIVVGNKCDLLAAGKDLCAIQMKELQELRKDYPFVVDSLTCSSRTLMNVDNTILIAQNAVLYPLNPLYDVNACDVTDKFHRALVRMFRLFDRDRDFRLSENELSRFLSEGFGVGMVRETLFQIKKMITTVGEHSDEAGVTFKGFCQLHLYFLRKNRAKHPWDALRYLGYDDDVTLQLPSDTPSIELKSDQHWQLSKSGLRFFDALFNQFDRNDDGLLNHDELAELMEVMDDDLSQMIELPVCFSDACEGAEFSLSHWLAEWSAMAELDPQLLLKCLHIFGYNGKLSSALCKVKKNQANRSTVRCCVTGAIEEDCMVLLKHLAGYNPTVALEHHCAAKYIALASEGAGFGEDRKLFMLDYLNPEDAAKTFAVEKYKYDVILFVYDGDSLDSFLTVKDLMGCIPKKTPVALLQGGRDLVNQGSVVPNEAAKLCGDMDIALPFDDTAEIHQLFSLLVELASDPESSIPTTPEERASIQRKKVLKRCIKLVALGGTLLGLGFAIKSMYNRNGEIKATAQKKIQH